jgi:hypothetical protein
MRFTMFSTQLENCETVLQIVTGLNLNIRFTTRECFRLTDIWTTLYIPLVSHFSGVDVVSSRFLVVLYLSNIILISVFLNNGGQVVA